MVANVIPWTPMSRRQGCREGGEHAEHFEDEEGGFDGDLGLTYRFRSDPDQIDVHPSPDHF